MLIKAGARLLTANTRNIIQKRTFEASSVVSGPPTVRVSMMEKVATGLFMSACWLAYPVWVIVHIREYKS